MLKIILLSLFFSKLSAFLAVNNKWVRNSQMMDNKIDGIVVKGELTPLSNNLLIRVKEAISSTIGGIYIPDNAKERPTEGKVIAAGPGRVHPETAKQLDIAVKVGESVIYGKYDGSELKYNDINHQLIKDDDVLLKYSGDTATLENVECVKDQVLVLPAPKEESTADGLILSKNLTPGGSEMKPDNGLVVKVGPGRQAGSGEYMKIQVQPGDHCRFRDYASVAVKIEGKEYLVVRAYDVVAKW